MAASIRRVAGNLDIKVKRLPWAAMRLVAPFNETMRELLEIKPLWRKPIRLDNTRLLATLGAEPATPLDQAIAATLRGLGCLVTPSLA